MLMDKPESDIYACNIDTDNDEITTIVYDTDDDDDGVDDDDDDYDDKHNAKVDAYRIKMR
jgi:hypothetical protein